jgi:hypothetical protein
MFLLVTASVPRELPVLRAALRDASDVFAATEKAAREGEWLSLSDLVAELAVDLRAVGLETNRTYDSGSSPALVDTVVEEANDVLLAVALVAEDGSAVADAIDRYWGEVNDGTWTAEAVFDLGDVDLSQLSADQLLDPAGWPGKLSAEFAATVSQ